jgi:hypothetical protein
MAPDAPMWQIAMVSIGAGIVAISLRKLSERPLLKVIFNFLMITILLWVALMAADICVAAIRGTLLSPLDRPIWILLGTAGVLTLTGQSFSAWRISKRKSATLIEQKLLATEHSLAPKSQGASPHGRRKQLVRQ